MSQNIQSLSSKDVRFNGEVVNRPDGSVLMPPFSSQMGAVPGRQVQNDGQLASSASSSISFPDDVLKFLQNFDFDMENLTLFSDRDLEQVVHSYESDVTKSLILLNRLQKIRKTPNSTKLAVENGKSSDSKMSNFGSASFPSGSSKCRDVNKWPLVLGRSFLGESDKCSVSKFCTLLISYGVKESATSVEFFRYVLYNLSSELNVEVVNFLMGKNVVDDSHDSLRLSMVYDYLKSRFAITDNPTLLFANLENTKQGNRPIAEFSSEFRTRVEELRIIQSSSISEPYILSIYKRSLHEAYRRFADENVHVSSLTEMIETLMLYERNFQLREGFLPCTKSAKVKVNAVRTDICSFCKKSGHIEERCWAKNPSLRPKCDKCGRSHTGKCWVKGVSNTEPCPDDGTRVAKSSLIQASPSLRCNLNCYKPWQVTLQKYSISPIVDSGASCSTISPVFANEIVNKFKETTDIIELAPTLSVEFGNSNKVTAKQSVILRDALNGKPIEFVVVPTLNLVAGIIARRHLPSAVLIAF